MKTLLPFLLAIAASCAITSTLHAAVSIGKPAPDFTLTDPDGNRHALSDYAGRIVVLEWVNHGCPFVGKHYGSGNMQKLQKTYTGADVVWLTICSSAPGQQGHESAAGWKKEIAAKGMAPTALLMDEAGAVGRMYGAKTTPHMYVIDSKGNLAYMGAIDSIASTRVADVEKAENYVVAAIASIKAGEPVAKPTSNPYGCNVKYSRGT